jgi:hypothetical protein
MRHWSTFSFRAGEGLSLRDLVTQPCRSVVYMLKNENLEIGRKLTAHGHPAFAALVSAGGLSQSSLETRIVDGTWYSGSLGLEHLACVTLQKAANSEQ